MSYDLWLEADLGGSSPSQVQGLDWNYTSNCAAMWRLAMPETDGLAGFDGKTALECGAALDKGLAAMRKDPAAYRALNPENGWGDFEGQMRALNDLLEAFDRAPRATVRVGR